MSRNTICNALLITGLFTSMLIAAPIWNEPCELRQPDGSLVNVIVNGDEYYQDVETPDGYTLLRDPQTQWICYATLSDDKKTFVSTGVVYKNENALAKKSSRLNNLEQHLRISSDAALQIRSSKIQELHGSTSEVSIDNKAGLGKTTAVGDTVMGITVLIDFPDQKTEIPFDSIVAFVNATGYKANKNNGSVKEYFYDVSNGKLTYMQIVTPFVTAKNNKAFYDRTDGSGYAGSTELLNEILTTMKTAGTFDFSKGTVTGTTRKTLTAVNFLYAGSPTAGWAQGLWPHSGSMSFSINGVYVSSHQMSNIGKTLTIGTFCHENGHMLCKWPDLYAYDGHSNGAGGFDIMCSSGATNPVPPNAYLRSLRGWLTLKEISKDQLGTVYKLPADLQNAYVYSGTSSTSAQELFCIEARRRTGRSATLPDSGLIIWHIDKSGDNTTTGKNDFAVPEQADGKNDLELKKNNGNIGDLFRSNSVTIFNDSTTPNANFHNGTKSGLQIANVGPVRDTMTFSLGAMTTSAYINKSVNNTLSINVKNGIVAYVINDEMFSNTPLTISLYDVSGRMVVQIVNNDYKADTQCFLNLKDAILKARGTNAAAGRYLCKLADAKSTIATVPVVLQ